MGTCVSVHKDGEPEARLGPNNEKLLMQGGSKESEEAFFDSQPWIESDGESDYFSVNGDLTPSRSCGSTPVHRSFNSPKRVSVSQPGDGDENKTPFSKKKKKRLSELFRESLGGDERVTFKIDGGDKTPNAAYDYSWGNGGRTAEKESKIVECCIPKPLWSRSFIRRGKKMNPRRIDR